MSSLTNSQKPNMYSHQRLFIYKRRIAQQQIILFSQLFFHNTITKCSLQHLNTYIEDDSESPINNNTKDMDGVGPEEGSKL